MYNTCVVTIIGLLNCRIARSYGASQPTGKKFLPPLTGFELLAFARTLNCLKVTFTGRSRLQIVLVSDAYHVNDR